jgi:hypothetical protein
MRLLDTTRPPDWQVREAARPALRYNVAPVNEGTDSRVVLDSDHADGYQAHHCALPPCALSAAFLRGSKPGTRRV